MAKKTPNRNEPCSCGSGKKYKRCCEAKVHARGPGATRFLSWGLIAIVAIGVWITVDRIRGGSLSGPEPYEYNAATNQHWHAQHQHWHSGPPPPPDQR